MALTAKQRAKLPASAFVYPSVRKYPVPTKAQARKAGITEKQRVATHRAAKSYAARKATMGTPAKVNALVHKRGPLRAKGRKR
jgi:hypothetical protein